MELQAYIAKQVKSATLAPKTINNVLALLKQMVKAAVDWGYLTAVPLTAVKKLRRPRREVRLWTRAEIRKFLLHARPRLIARAQNHLRENAKTTTSDAEITRRTALLIDLDPTRPAGIPSSAAEHDAALALARTLYGWLIEQGVPRGALCVVDSGNGVQIHLLIDLPHDKQAAAEVDLRCRRVLEALDALFSTDLVRKSMGGALVPKGETTS